MVLDVHYSRLWTMDADEDMGSHSARMLDSEAPKVQNA